MKKETMKRLKQFLLHVGLSMICFVAVLQFTEMTPWAFFAIFTCGAITEVIKEEIFK